VKRLPAALLAFVVCMGLSGCQPSRSQQPTSAKTPSGEQLPNVLIFITDDQRAGTLDALPSVKRHFQQQGVSFPNAYATTPICCPSRATIMSGRYAHNHKVRYFQPYKLDQRSTLQQALVEAGYRTGFFGKYLNGWSLPDDPPYFDQWAVFPQSTPEIYRGGRWNTDGVVREIQSYWTHFLRRRVESFLSSQDRAEDASPWLLYVSVPAPHPPIVAEPRYEDASVPVWKPNPAQFDDASNKPHYVSGRTTRECDLQCGRRLRRAQYRALLSVDDLIARVFAKLKSLGESRDTLSFFTSDNGIHWGEFGLAGKRYPYRSSVRVPLLMRWPRRVRPRIDKRLVANLDIAATVFDAAKIVSADTDGRSLLKRWSRRRLLLEHWGIPKVPQWASLVSKRFQYIEYYKDSKSSKPFAKEYYNLRKDEWQLENLLAGKSSTLGKKRLSTLHYHLKHDRQCLGSSCP